MKDSWKERQKRRKKELKLNVIFRKKDDHFKQDTTGVPKDH
jgi:hypothetical protein